VTRYIKLNVVKKIFLSSLLVYKHLDAEIGMERAVCAVPAQCRKCGELFDLSYDLDGFGDERLVEFVRSTRSPKSAMCWECRVKR